MQLTVVEADLGDVFSDIARVHIDHRPFAKAGKLVVIYSGNNKAYAVARGSMGNAKDTISLDSATREKLGVKPKQNVSFTIRPARFIDEFRWAWSATDAMPRVAARLGVLSVGLGMIGLFLGAISLCR